MYNNIYTWYDLYIIIDAQYYTTYNNIYTWYDLYISDMATLEIQYCTIKNNIYTRYDYTGYCNIRNTVLHYKK